MTPARIGLRVLGNPLWQGGINYVINWAKAAAVQPPEARPDIYLLVTDERTRPIAESLRSLVTDVQPFEAAASLDLDLVYPATQIVEAPVGAPWAAWIPDFQHLHLPDMFDALEHERRRIHYTLLATEAPFLVLSSTMAVEDARRTHGAALVPHVKLPFPAMVEASEPAVDLRKYQLPPRFFIVANQWWRHKNHRMVLEALAQPELSDVHCVFTGATYDRRWPADNEQHQELIRKAGIADRVHIIGAVERAEQLALLRRAVAVVQPSLFEGWSTVVEEARALRLPIVLSDIPVHREQCPPQSRFFDVSDLGSLVRQLRQVWDTQSMTCAAAETIGYDQAHVRDCVDALCRTAKAARRAYDPTRHDPVILLAKLLPTLVESGDPLHAKLLGSMHYAIRTTMINQPAALTELHDRISAINRPYGEVFARAVLSQMPKRGLSSSLPQIVKRAAKRWLRVRSRH